MMKQNIPPRLIAIHDISGFGRTSLTVVMPLISAMGIQVCPLPTALLSTHTTEFTDFSFCDLTLELPKILDHWQKLKLKFEGVYSGFLATHTQVEIVERAIHEFLKDDGIAVVDPVMGDNGILDPTITQDIVEAMRHLITQADIITPNYSESCFLLDEEPKHRSLEEVKIFAKRLAQTKKTSRGPKIVVITSIPTDDKSQVYVLAYEKSKDKFHLLSRPYIPAFYPGTGDTFASALTGNLMNKLPLEKALENSVHFVTEAIKATYYEQTIPREGILLENLLALRKEKLI